MNIAAMVLLLVGIVLTVGGWLWMEGIKGPLQAPRIVTMTGLVVIAVSVVWLLVWWLVA